MRSSLFHSRYCFRVLALVLVAAPFAAAQDPIDYLLQTGKPTFAAVNSFPGGTVNLANGNMHVEIPIGSYPQRGGNPVTIKLVYDSRLWLGMTGSNNWTSTQNPNDPLVAELPYFGWRIVGLPPDGGGLNHGIDRTNSLQESITCGGIKFNADVATYHWVGPDGTPHLFDTEGFYSSGTNPALRVCAKISSHSFSDL